MKTPLILAHRGASAEAPENTLVAFRRARELGADGVELDVTLTRDHVPVVIHDDTVDRTTDGHGSVSAMTVLEIKHLDAGKWKSQEFLGEAIPTLAEVFDAFAKWTKGPGTERRGVINVELKSTTIRTDGVERQVVSLVEQKRLEESVILSSFNPLALMREKVELAAVTRSLVRPQLAYLFTPHLAEFPRGAARAASPSRDGRRRLHEPGTRQELYGKHLDGR